MDRLVGPLICPLKGPLIRPLIGPFCAFFACGGYAGCAYAAIPPKVLPKMFTPWGTSRHSSYVLAGAPLSRVCVSGQ